MFSVIRRGVPKRDWKTKWPNIWWRIYDFVLFVFVLKVCYFFSSYILNKFSFQFVQMKNIYKNSKLFEELEMFWCFFSRFSFLFAYWKKYIDINNWYFSREDKTEKNWKLSRRSYSRITSQRELKAILHFELTFRVESLITVRLGVQI